MTSEQKLKIFWKFGESPKSYLPLLSSGGERVTSEQKLKIFWKFGESPKSYLPLINSGRVLVT